MFTYFPKEALSFSEGEGGGGRGGRKLQIKESLQQFRGIPPVAKL